MKKVKLLKSVAILLVENKDENRSHDPIHEVEK